MGPRWRISCSICSRRDNALASLASLSGRHPAAGDSAILRGAGKHFDEIVVQAVVELVLQMPGELRMIEVAGMDRKHVGVNRDGRALQIDQDFDNAVIFARGKGEQRMIVELQVIENFLQGVGVWHGFIVFGGTAPARSRRRAAVPK